MISRRENEERMELYNQGLTDSQISDRLMLSHGCIRYWRVRRGLPANYGGKGRRLVDKSRFRELWEQGMNDSQIARECGCHCSTVLCWRQEENLPMNYQRERVNHDDWLPYYERGLSDYQVASLVGTTATTVQKWRKRKGLKANFPAIGGNRHAAHI